MKRKGLRRRLDPRPMTLTTTLQAVARRPLARLDAWMNQLYGWRGNPLYHSGAIAAVLFLVLLVTGLYLLIFYRIGAPYDSVARMTADPWLGRWIRGVHRYASDAVVVAVAIHAFRLFAQGRSWGPRALAWITGVILLFVTFLCGWTGYVMVWDVQAQVLAEAGARLFDLVPIFAEPISRAFVGERPLPGAFFFLNLFLHIALPIALGLLVWLHVSRVARPGLLPPRALLWGGTALLVGLALAWPVAMAPAADLLRLPGRAPYDLFYSFWLPLARTVPAGVVWALATTIGGVALLAPLWSRPRVGRRGPPSVVDERYCTGCEQCYLDCPYEAIAMVARPEPLEGRSAMVARVNPAHCVSCGICAGSCAPMRVGPARRTGRDQLARVREFVAARPGPAEVVVISCERGAGGVAAGALIDGAPVYPVDCAGSLHTSVVEYLVRSGAAGVLVISCPPRDCWSREGPKWLEQRLYHEREAELLPRVDRRRVRVAYAGAGERDAVHAALAAFRRDIAALEPVTGESDIDLVTMCETAEAPR
jgi:coenzyme F420-reducing hydrogenase delta subunit/NAD-dependent dihydropyrimidine dehydrogenase PreA subunit